jgi:threonyl-tRNA synthetase
MSKKQSYEESQLYKLRHSAAHIMAQAVLEMFPDGKIAIGPPIDSGFYYDFDLSRALTPDDLEVIEKRMREIIGEDHIFARREVSADEARALFEGQQYKLELIDGLEAGQEDEYGNKVEGEVVISTYKHDTFEDLCRGPHVESTGKINPDAVRLLSLAGAYWRGDENRPQLQRIYGTAFKTAAELEEHLHNLDEAKKRDHRRLGQELGLFTFSQEVGKGLPLFLPKGTIVRDLLERFLRDEQLRRGYSPVVTPHIAKIDLYKTSGHWDTYRDHMYAPIEVEGEEFILKPMNCPHHIEIYKSEMRSYRDLPLRLAEFGQVYRYEDSGNLTGMTRVRGFTVDDSHLFVTPEQLEDEFLGVVDLTLFVFENMGMDNFETRVGLRDSKSDKYVGSDEVWETAENAIIQAVEKRGMSYLAEEGEAAFYGPKLDFIFHDVLGREWQLGTVQVDYNLPERFELEYIGADNQPHRPVMIHRAPFGSLERFMGLLIEHYAGAFPVWLAPVQATILPVTDDVFEYAQEVADRLKAANIRYQVDTRGERLGAMIRDAQMMKIPYMLVVGRREAEGGQVAVRLRTEEDLGAMDLDAFIKMAQEAIAEKQLN